MKGRLFRIDDDFQVGESSEKYDAVGSGTELALGALYATNYLEPGYHPHVKIKIAIRAATKFNITVGGPIDIVSN